MFHQQLYTAGARRFLAPEPLPAITVAGKVAGTPLFHDGEYGFLRLAPLRCTQQLLAYVLEFVHQSGMQFHFRPLQLDAVSMQVLMDPASLDYCCRTTRAPLHHQPPWLQKRRIAPLAVVEQVLQADCNDASMGDRDALAGKLAVKIAGAIR
jgi:hypothetical protein